MRSAVAEEADIDAYFERIGFAGSIAPSLETLGLLHLQHPMAIPFENLDPLMGAPVRLDLANLQQKLLFDRRGGYCLEHNLLFKAVLQSLDFDVKVVGARSLRHPAEDGEQPIGHIALITEISGVPYLTDPGFSAVTLTAPLRLKADIEQDTPHGKFRLLDGQPVWRLETLLGEKWSPLYSFERAEFGLDAIAELNERASTTGTQRDNLIAARVDRTHRHTLRNLSLKRHGLDGTTERREIASVQEIRDVLEQVFGVALPSDERLQPALETLFARFSGSA